MAYICLLDTSQSCRKISKPYIDKQLAEVLAQQEQIPVSYTHLFILRYPQGKQEITGTSYEPWHYRYVGVDAAREIYERGICLEEYFEQ